jgi:hypothetical protein
MFLDRVFNFKLDHIGILGWKCMTYMLSCLKLKLGLCPVS